MAVEPRQQEYKYRDGRFVFGATCMGTGFIFSGNSPLGEAQTLLGLEAAMAILDEADRTFSLYKPESPLSRLARGETSVAQCPPVVSEVWDACEHWEKVTDGWFCAFTPEHTFDPSGLVKTWAARAAASSLLGLGIVDFTINAGGDIYLADAATAPNDWRVAVHKPVSILSDSAGVLLVVDLTGTSYRAVCTSGIAERGNHIWNPKAGDAMASGELVQVTAIAADLVQADVWATAAFAEGARSLRHLDAWNTANPLNQVQLLAVFTDGSLAATQGFEALLAKPAADSD
ncbi:MAG: FAD:protein FMN transferase [Micrococcales bacterium]